MAKQLTYSFIVFISAVFFSLSVIAKCNQLPGVWEGAYKIKPHYFGFSVGFCNYQSSISISRSQDHRYSATIINTLVESKGRVGESCQQTLVVKATMTCDASGVMLTTEGGHSLPSIDMPSRWQTDSVLTSKGGFDHKYGERTLDIDYSFKMKRQSSK